VVRRFSSGGNTFTIHADGSIEAETPEGVFRYASFEELRAAMSQSQMRAS
jgi:hypothetical protein